MVDVNTLSGTILLKLRSSCPDQQSVARIYMDTGLIRPYSVIQWRWQWSAFRGWPSHSMCSRPHFTGKPDWPRADFTENCLLQARSKASAVSRFREKLSHANGVQGITAISRKIALLGVMSAKLAKWVAKKWGPTCDRDISDSAIYTTAIYRAYTVYGATGPKWVNWLRLGDAYMRQ